MTDCEKFKGLLVGLMDNELTSEEIHEINAHLTRCASCRDDYNQLQETGKKIGAVSFTEPTDAELEKLWKRPYSRFMKISGLALVIGGWLAFLFKAVYEIFRTSDEPLFSRIAGGSLLIGFLVLLIYVILERMSTYKSDPYKEVQR